MGGSGRRTLAVVLVGALLVVGGGIVAFGILTGPVGSPVGSTGDSPSEATVPAEAFKPPVNSTALRAAHTVNLNASGSFTVVEESSLESTAQDGPSRSQTITAAFDIESEQALITVSTDDSSRTSYATGDEQYTRIEGPSGDVRYQVPEREVTPDPYLDSAILGELETMDVDHRETDAGHVYTADSVDAVPNRFLDGDTDSFQAFEFEALVSERGVIEEFSYRIEIAEGDAVVTITRAVEVTETGTTEVRELPWLGEAREATG